MRLFGLIGYPLGHSFSKRYFTEKFSREGILDARYEHFPLENVADLPALIAQNPDLRGLNVTIPHKETVLPLLHALDETARAVGAVNCIKVIDGQHLVGFNTDVIGFEKSLSALDWAKTNMSAFILGTGGASKAVAFVLKKRGIAFAFVSRNPQKAAEISYQDLEKLVLRQRQSSIFNRPSFALINTTPLGTFPNTEQMPPVPSNLFKPDMFVYDLVYNPAETLLLRGAKAHGCAVKNGLEMLELQADAAWEIWQ